MRTVVGLIGGSGLLKTSLPALQNLSEELVDTAHGRVFLRTGSLADGSTLVFVQRHDARPSRSYTQPADINYAAVALALKAKGCQFVVAICSVGGLKQSHGVGTLLVCDDFWCPSDLRRVYEDARAHLLPSLSEPLREAVLDIVRRAGEHPLPTGVYANARGPRFESRAEIRMMADYCDVVGMTGAHEIAACNEVGLPYAMLAMVDNYANGVGSDTLSLESFHAAQARNLSRLETCVGALLAELPTRAGGLFSTAAAPESSSESMSSGSASATHAAAGPKPVDLIVHARWVVPVAPGREEDVYDRHAVVVEHGRIVDILPSADVGPLYAATRVVTLGEKHVLMPGLVNAHTHLAMMLLKGVADDLPLFQWLSEQIWPTEGRLVSSAFVAAGARAAFAELIRGGVTCVNDMYFFPCQTAAVAEEVGMRALVASPVLEFPSNYASDAEGYLAKGEALHQTLNSRGDRARVRAAFGPHAPYTVSDATLEKISAMSLKTGARVHMHLHETAGEVLASETGGAQGPPSSKHLSSQSCTPVANLARLGLLNERLIAVHMTTLSDADIAAVAAAGTSVVHCPTSNLKLASGFSPVAKLLKAGINVALGSDSSASNNAIDLFAEMKLAAILAKAVAGEPSVVPASQALRMATLNGARALGFGDITGSLEVGKAADFIAVDLGEIESLPCYSVISHLVYATGRNAVSDVWVDGTQLLAARTLTTIDENATKAELRAWAQKVREGKTAEDGHAAIPSKFRGPHGCGLTH